MFSREETARYIADLATELSKMASTHDLQVVSLLLKMAAKQVNDATNVAAPDMFNFDKKKKAG